MLEKIPAGLGHALRGVRAGFEKIVGEEEFGDVPETLTLESPAFADGGPLPIRYTDDGAKLSPPLSWRGDFGGAASLALIVEDPDAPTPEPLAHLLVWDLPPAPGDLPEGALKSPDHPGAVESVGRNSFLATGWLPPDPPRGHGTHVYVFQLFALDRRLDLASHPGRSELVRAMRSHVIGKGVLVGTYERA